MQELNPLESWVAMLILLFAVWGFADIVISILRWIFNNCVIFGVIKRKK